MWAIAGAVCVAVLGFLFVWMSYASGYGDARISIFQFARTLWDQNEDWQHCYLVPFAVGAMVWTERHALNLLPIRGNWAGLAVLIFGIFTYWVGYRADNVYIGYFTFLVMTAGLVIWLLGWAWMGALFFPWAFLIFLFPLVFLDNVIAFPLRIVMSKVSVAFLNLIGIPTLNSGTAILSAPDPLSGHPAGELFSVDVADPCSGIRSLFALMMVSTLYGFFTQRVFWKRAVIFLCSAPLAIAGNLARILMLTFGVIAMGPEKAIGTLEHPSFFHMLAGYIVFAVALAGMIAVGTVVTNGHEWFAALRSLARRRPVPTLSGTGVKDSTGKPKRPTDEY